MNTKRLTAAALSAAAVAVIGVGSIPAAQAAEMGVHRQSLVPITLASTATASADPAALPLGLRQQA